MKRITIYIFAIATMLLVGTADASAQKWLKNLGKAAPNVLNSAAQLTDTIPSTATAVSNLTSASSSSSSADSAKTRSVLLDETISYTAKVTYKTDENGDTLKNDDGTLKKFVYIYDSNGNAVDATTAKKMVSSRLKAYWAIIGKVTGGAAIGVASAFLGGNKKDALEAGLAGGLAGLALSGDDMSKVKKLNKQLKKYREVIDDYQSNFNDEGTPKDASVDLAKIYPDAEVVTKSASAIDAEIAASKEQVDPLEDFDPGKI